MTERAAPGINLNPNALTILRALLDTDPVARFGNELCHATGLKYATIYPVMRRLITIGWVVGSWEDPEVSVAAGRPRRRYYSYAPGAAAIARAVTDSLTT